MPLHRQSATERQAAELAALRALIDEIRMMIDDPEVLNMIDEVYPRRAVS